MPKPQKLIVILGPTASGKTELSLHLAKKFNGYIISADSRQIYQGMDIGTGKLMGGTWKKNKKLDRVLYFHNIPHYMIDIVKPDREFTVAQYQEEVNKIIKKNQPQLPFLVGGTGLYISAVIDGLSIPCVPPDKKLRRKLEQKTNQELLTHLKKLDPVTSQKIDSKNKRRLIRALEVCLKTGKPFSELRKKRKPNFDVLQIGLSVPRQELYQRINKRVDKMIEQGLVEETKRLIQKFCRGDPRVALARSRPAPTNNNIWDLPPHQSFWCGGVPAMSGLGYKQIGMYLRGEISLSDAIDLIKKETRHYARRQMTWFKRDKRIKWVKNKIVGARFIAPEKQAEKLVRDFLKP